MASVATSLTLLRPEFRKSPHQLTKGPGKSVAPQPGARAPGRGDAINAAEERSAGPRGDARAGARDAAERAAAAAKEREALAEMATDSAASCAISSQRIVEAPQTIFFLDWDDTLFPTTAIFEGWGFPSNPDLWAEFSLTVLQRKELLEYRQALMAYLRMCSSLSEACVIVTNAERPWVHQCVDYFVPEMRELLCIDAVRVVYAREMQGNRKHTHQLRPVRHAVRGSYSMTPLELAEYFTATKTAAMRREVKYFYSSHSDKTWRNIVSVGDAYYEQMAIQEVAFTCATHEKVHVKALREHTPQSIRELAGLLRLRRLTLAPLIHYDGDVIGDLGHLQPALCFDELLSLLGMPPLGGPPEALEEAVAHIQKHFHNVHCDAFELFPRRDFSAVRGVRTDPL